MAAIDVCNHLFKIGVLSKEFTSATSKLHQMGPIPQQVFRFITPEQAKGMAEERVAACAGTIKQFSLLYKATYGKFAKAEKWEGPIHSAAIFLGHDADRIVPHAAKAIAQGKYSYALAHLSELPEQLRNIKLLFMGLGDVDIRKYFPDIEWSSIEPAEPTK